MPTGECDSLAGTPEALACREQRQLHKRGVCGARGCEGAAPGDQTHAHHGEAD